jgi:hypothetical protein
MLHESEVSLRQILDTVLPRYGFAAEVSCRCCVCGSHRATRLAQALNNKFGHGLALKEEIDEP